MESMLLLFSHELPVWDSETVALAGEEPDNLNKLVNSGDLFEIADGYALTPQGVRTREAVSKEFGVPVSSYGEVIIDASRARELLELNRMTQFLDSAFVTDWGIKEVTTREVFPVVPCLNDDEYFKLENNKIKAIWPEHELIKSFIKTFPNWGVSARKFPAPGQLGLDLWANANNAPRGSLTIDFMLRGRADFNHYKDYDQMSTDIFKFLDADRLFAQKIHDGNFENLLPFIGKLHIFLTEQRRIFVPGWFDIDHDENEDWILLCFVTDKESQLENLVKTIRQWGHDLINPVNPLYIIGTSIERLRTQKEQKRTIYDWFQEETVRIIRPDAPDGE